MSSPSSQHDDAAQAAENPVIMSRSIMVGSSPSISRDNSSVGLDISNSSNASIRERVSQSMPINNATAMDGDYDAHAASKSAASAPPITQSNPRNNYNVEDLVRGSVADAGLNAYGCVFVEVWVMNSDGTALSRVEPGGHWMDPSFANSLPTAELRAQALELNRYARDCPPGAGLAGTVFNEAALSRRKVHWRQIRSMLNDPFVQRGSGQSMSRLHDIGVGIVGSVPFSFQDEDGLVCFYSRTNVNMELLRSPMNEGFLIGSTDLIGANYAIRKNREACAAMRRELFLQAIKKVKKEFRKGKLSFGDLATSKSALELLAKARDEAQSPLEEDDMMTRVKKRVVKLGKKCFKRINNSRKKWKGTKLQGPARQSFLESAFVAFGVFFTMLTVLKLADAINGADSTFRFDGGWYASTLCITFALTPAPVGQPRQIFAAHMWNMLVGLALRQIPPTPTGFVTQDFMEWNTDSYGLPLIWKQALAVAIGVAGQAKLGILHPPATGLSYAFVSSNKYSWGTISSVYLADAVIVALSVLILNLSEAKQYPLFWFGLEWGDSGRCWYVQSRKRLSATWASKRKVKGDDNNV